MKPQRQTTVYRGRIFDVTLQGRRLPDGRSITAEVIRHPGAALIVPFLTPDRVIFLRQFRPAINAWLYELPAGTPEKNESFLRCARRELQEESGYAAARFSLLGKIVPVPGYSTEVIHIYKAQKLTPSFRQKDAEEVIETHVLDRRRVRGLMARGRLIDAKTICALCFCGWL
ncbi:MAG: NUDIX hydrolase [Candidatus Omnitrophota bacterium]